MSNYYQDLPLTNFPDAVDQRIVMIDPSMPEDVTVIKSFHAAMDSKNILLATQILRDNPRLEKMIFNAAKFNHLEDAVIAIQRMWNSEISEYLRVAIETVGAGVTMNQVYGLVAALAGKSAINHTHTPIDIGAQAKLMPIVGELDEELWVGSASPYTQEATVAGVGATGDLLVFPQCVTDDQIEAWSESKVTATGQSAGKVTFTATGDKPLVALPFMVINLG